MIGERHEKSLLRVSFLKLFFIGIFWLNFWRKKYIENIKKIEQAFLGKITRIRKSRKNLDDSKPCL